jgi:hypothetical protein
MLTTFFALALLAAALALVWIILRLLWTAALPPIGTQLERWRFDRCLARVERGDRYLREGELAAALGEFEAAFYPHPTRLAALAEAVNRHHTGLLGRLMAAADQLQDERVRLISLAKVDRLFHERRSLQRRYLTLGESGTRQRRREIERELRQNTRALRTALASLVAEIGAAGAPARLH